MTTKTQFLILLFIFFINSVFGQDVRVAVIGDFGAATLGPPHINNEAAVADLVKSWDSPTQPLDAIITVGDNNYPHGLMEDIEINIGQFYGEYIQGHPNFLGGANRFFPSIGNHDYDQQDCNLPGNPNPYLNYFELPGNELYYDFVIGDVHFFVVDSDCHQADGTNPWEPQGVWLQNQMTNSPHPWKIVYFHHAPYSSSSNGNNGYMQWDFKAWGATAVIGGHYHFYERLQVDGLTYFVNGIGGNSLHNFPTVLPQSQVRYSQKHGAMLMTFSGNEANFLTTNIDHEVVDDYTIINDTITGPNPGNCDSIVGHTKLGEYEGKGYYISNNTATSWADAKNKSEALDGKLISMETQAEKNFIDPFIAGTGDERVIYIGLKRNNLNDLEWESGELFDSNNYTDPIWDGSSNPNEQPFGSVRKWNPSADARWGMENGTAHRKYILEKTCSSNLNCIEEGGDTDGDGICDNNDCDINNPNLPAPVGSSCNDNNPDTMDDVIQADSCTCLGVTNPMGTDCVDIVGYTKLGDFNGHGYYRSEFNAKGWEDAKTQSMLDGGNLISIENSAEKNFIDQYISASEDNVIYIGLKRNNQDLFEWTSGDIFNASNYTTSPWSSGVVPTSDDFVTLRKWNENSPVVWGAESGKAYRKFILEKTCALDCSQNGGDTDGDGVCDIQDCAPNDPNFPLPPGTSCDDENPDTANDIIGEDGCTCSGDPIIVGNQLCDDIVINAQSNSIIIENINAPISIVKIYNSNWDKVFECINSCGTTVVKSDLDPGQYYIDIQLFDEMWVSICTRNEFILLNSDDDFDVENTSSNFMINKNTLHNISEFNISIYPNPTQDELFINFGNGKIINLFVYDNTGKIIKQLNFKSQNPISYQLNTQQLEDGIYLLNVELENNQSVSKRFIVKRD